ncbi:tyrosine-type recombinase/integrase [Peribacillus frigoritolerans]|uniref:tyrosine-type recombinase/integrase n=1 Tax=Peribacillus frigoritolerans TaxID=450367 RepID=UPI00228091D0|nr:tyrosine-type recombinase/integrase [Peribacillus frigoritolerans]MCY9005637.1 tyrosine-type recombinase/integrase [Peribacillus frigoritolerans]
MSKRRTWLTEDELKIVTKTMYVTSDEEALRLFFEDCKLRNLRPHTLKYYHEQFNAIKRPLVSMTERDIKLLILNMQEKDLKVTSINTRLRALRSFFLFLYKNKHIKKNPMANVKLLKERNQIVNSLSEQQLQILFSLCDNKTFVGLRDLTIMMLFIDAGIRLNELTGIDLSDVKEESIAIRETKTYFERLLPISKKMKEQLEIYIKIRGKCNTEKLFINQDGGGLKPRSVQNRIEHYAKLSGIEGVRISCHTFRHTHARLFIQNGGSAFHLQAMLGHQSMEITKKYVNLFATDVQESHKKYSPLKNLF